MHLQSQTFLKGIINREKIDQILNVTIRNKFGRISQQKVF
jgi:hypothetical protein